MKAKKGAPQMRLKYRLRSISLLILTLLALISVLPPELNAQSAATKNNENFTPGIDIAGGVSGQMTFARNPVTVNTEGNFTIESEKSQSLSPSSGALFTFHQAMKPYLGYNVNFDYTSLKQSYSQGSASLNSNKSTTPTSFAAYSFSARMYELTVAYAFSGPRFERFRTFGQFGGGGLFFEPAQAPFAKEQTRPAMVFGIGIERDFSTHFSIRAEYRGLFYKGPDYQIDRPAYVPQQRLFTVTNQPTISLVYRFRVSKEFNHKVPKFSMIRLLKRDRSSNGD
jgi:opacity protein-like surface antigen